MPVSVFQNKSFFDQVDMEPKSLVIVTIEIICRSSKGNYWKELITAFNS